VADEHYIERHPIELALPLMPPSSLQPSASISTQSSEIDPSSPEIISDDSLVPPRREYVWRTIDRGRQSLATVARRMALDLDMRLEPAVSKLATSDTRSAHRCAGYVREEITLASTMADSAVISHDTPSPSEMCPVCQEIVGFHDEFRCVCGDPCN
jgi:hypothetical protein